MAHSSEVYDPGSVRSIERIIQQLGDRLEQTRLGLNLSQAQVAKEAGVSRRTITRMESGEVVSLDTFVRVLKVYGLSDRLDVLFPDTTISPLERVEQQLNSRSKSQKPRQRASNRNKGTETSQQPWVWGEDA